MPTYALNFYSPVVADQLRSRRKTATIRLGDKSGKYKKGMIVRVLAGTRFGVRELIFCGTLTTGGLEESVGPDGVRISREGRVRRFVEAVEQITFNARLGLAAGKRLTIVTDRGVLTVDRDGLALREVVPGVDVERDILGQIDFPVHVDPELKTVPERLLVPPASR